MLELPSISKVSINLFERYCFLSWLIIFSLMLHDESLEIFLTHIQTPFLLDCFLTESFHFQPSHANCSIHFILAWTCCSCLKELLALLRRAGASGIRVAPRTGQVFCDLPAATVESLKARGLTVKPLGKMSTQQYQAYGPITGTNAALAAFLDQAREVLTPPVLGEMWKVAVLDTGIRATHIMLRDKVVHERNYTSSATADDVFDHGTAVAGLIAGGRPVPGEEQGVAPGVQLLNIGVIVIIAALRELWFFMHWNEREFLPASIRPHVQTAAMAALIVACVFFRGPGSKFIYFQF